MKAFITGVLVGVMVGAGVYWFLTVDERKPAAQRAEERADAQTEKARQLAGESAEHAAKALSARMEALELRTEDIRKELAAKGRVVRRRAKDLGEAATSAALDARATAEIKAKLAAAPDLSALRISVSTTAGKVTLEGTVSSHELVGRAMALALETDGVRDVESRLRVESAARR